MGPAPFAQLQAFLAVARARSMSKAARELGVSRSAVSQAVQTLEDRLRVVLLVRTTRSVSLTDAGRRLVDSAGPALRQALDALGEVSAQPGEVAGRVRLTVPRAAVAPIVEPVVAAFAARHPRIVVEVDVEDRFVDIVAEGYDAGIRLAEALERDMIQVRLTAPFRFVVVGAPSYLARRGTPERPEDLLSHECITFRSRTTGALYAWELERGKRSYRVPVSGSVVSGDNDLSRSLAERGHGLVYAFEPRVRESIQKGKLRVVLDGYAPTVPGFFLYYPSRSRTLAPLRLFVEVAREVLGEAARKAP